MFAKLNIILNKTSIFMWKMLYYVANWDREAKNQPL